MIPIYSCLPIFCAFVFGGLSFAAENSSLTLADAVCKALQKNPAMAVYDAEMRISEAKLISAMARPNPELATEIEDVMGSGDYRGFHSAIYNLGVSQLIETGGKRRLRSDVARAEIDSQHFQYQVAKRELIAETGRRFVAALTAQNVEENARENFKIANDVFTTIQRQVEEGRGSSVDSGQALLGKNEAKLAYENARRESALARQGLSVLWLDTEPNFSAVSGNFLKPTNGLPGLEAMKTTIAGHPAIKLAESGIQVACTQLTLEERNKKPDVTVGLGYRRDSTVDDNALVLGFSVPIPLFNKNEGGIARATADLDRNKALVRQTETQLEMRIAQAYGRLSAAKAEYQLISGDMLSAAETHYAKVTEGFNLGRIKYIELLEARRSINAVRKQKIEALSRYHEARIELESITKENL